MNLRPLGNKIVVKRIEAEDKIGSIIVPENAKERPQRGTVLAVGNGTTLESGQLVPMSVKVGDVILFGRYAGTEIKVISEDVLVIREDDVLGIEEKDNFDKIIERANT